VTSSELESFTVDIAKYGPERIAELRKLPGVTGYHERGGLAYWNGPEDEAKRYRAILAAPAPSAAANTVQPAQRPPESVQAPYTLPIVPQQPVLQYPIPQRPLYSQSPPASYYPPYPGYYPPPAPAQPTDNWKPAVGGLAGGIVGGIAGLFIGTDIAWQLIFTGDYGMGTPLQICPTGGALIGAALCGGIGWWLGRKAQQPVVQQTTPVPKKGPCAIATAAYGTPLCEELDTLREFRDTRLETTFAGRVFDDFYYKVGPPIAKAMEKSPLLKGFFRKTVAEPAVRLARLSNK